MLDDICIRENITPRGDGNLIVEPLKLENKEIRENITPRGDGNNYCSTNNEM